MSHLVYNIVSNTLLDSLSHSHLFLSTVHLEGMLHSGLSGVCYPLVNVLFQCSHAHHRIIQSNIVIDGQGAALLSVFGYMTPVDEDFVAPLFDSAELGWERDVVRWAAPESLGLWIESLSLVRVLTEQSNIYSLGGIMLQVRADYMSSWICLCIHTHL